MVAKAASAEIRKRPAATMVSAKPGPKLHLSLGSTHNTTPPNKRQRHCDPIEAVSKQADEKHLPTNASVEAPSVPQAVLEHTFILGIPFQLLTTSELPSLTFPKLGGNLSEYQWVEIVGSSLYKGFARLKNKIGFWVMGDVEASLLTRLLQDHTFDVERLCRDHQRYQADPLNNGPDFSKASNVLVATGPAVKDDIYNRFSMKLDHRVDVHQFILKFQQANKLGHTRQLCQFVLHYDQTHCVFEGVHMFPCYVRANQAPFGAMMLLRGVMQVIGWYGCQDVLLPDGNIKLLLKKVKEFWADMKVAGTG
jgi:hypothetical protein